MPTKGSMRASDGGAGSKDQKLPSAIKKKSNDEIDEIFASKKAAKCDLGESKREDPLSVKPKEMKKKKQKNGKKGKCREKLNSMDTEQGSHPRKKTGDGLAIYTEAELGINKGDAGGTHLCPFDCSCCF